MQLAPEVRLGYHLIRRSGNLCVWFFFPHTVSEHHPSVQELVAEFAPLHGYLDGGHSQLVIITVPVSSVFAAIEQVLGRALERLPSAEWLYGNVYNPDDPATLLNWW